MDNAIWAALIGAIAAVAVGAFTIGYQIRQKRNDDKRQEQDAIKRRRMSVISDIIAYRFALTGGGKHTAADVSNFNAALCRIPVEFIEFPRVLELYHRLGEGFTSGKYYELVNALLRATDPQREPFELKILETVPAAYSPPLHVSLTNMQTQHQPEVSVITGHAAPAT